MSDLATSPVRRSLLIVEDEAMIAMMLEEYIDALGHEVHGVASTIAEASDMVRGGGFDFAILDCYLNGEEIWPVAEMLDREGIAFILSSGGALSDVPEAYARRPMLPKPYTMGAIADVLAAVDVAGD
ncbi:MAG: response regulator [Sphingomonadales bacterium]|nr:MAG: response regulator [Sphingomonadales bacterium]TNF04478.1 MAG: response regulator [Sphingomonadales bacterium]